MDAIRMYKIGLIDDFTMDLQGNQIAFETRNRWDSTEMYLQKKLLQSKSDMPIDAKLKEIQERQRCSCGVEDCQCPLAQRCYTF